jgi:hypothetical protein
MVLDCSTTNVVNYNLYSRERQYIQLQLIVRCTKKGNYKGEVQPPRMMSVYLGLAGRPGAPPRVSINNNYYNLYNCIILYLLLPTFGGPSRINKSAQSINSAQNFKIFGGPYLVKSKSKDTRRCREVSQYPQAASRKI